MTESPQQPEIIKNPFVKMSTKFVQGFKEWGAVIHTDTARSYFFPVAIIKHSASPVGVYQLVDFKDLPDELLAKFGLQKIPAKPVLSMGDIQTLIIVESEKIGFPTPCGGSGDFSETRIWRGDKAYELRFPDLEADYYGDTPENAVYGIIDGMASVSIDSVDMLNRFVSGEFGCSFVSTPKNLGNGEEI